MKQWCIGLGLMCLAMVTGCGQESAQQPPSSEPVSEQAALVTDKVKDDPIEVKVVVVTMFEVGEDTGDAPGEFQLWKERADLDTRFEFPQSFHDLYMNTETGVLGMVTGMGTAKSTSAIMALGLDPRFDLSNAYWLVAGISGFDPADASIGSAAWAEYLVDGDFGHEIDAREMPEDWSVGFIPLFAKKPYELPKPPNQGEMFHINPGLAHWAYQLTKDLDLPDDETIIEMRKEYTEFPNAQKPPFVMLGDQLAAMTFWHGELMNDWANDWVKYWSDNQGEFVSSAMEDTGTAQSLFYLDRAGFADYDRLMVLRTASNFTMPVIAGQTAAESLTGDGEEYAGLGLALEVAYQVGSTVVNEITGNWQKYKTEIPQAATVGNDE